MDSDKLLDIKLKEIQDNKKLWQSFGKKAFELTKKHDFKSYKTTKSKKELGVVHLNDFTKGINIGFTLGIIQAVRIEKYYTTGLASMQDILNEK